MEKECTRCKETKNYSEFYKDKRHKSGCTSECKKCKHEMVKKYRKTKVGKETKQKASRKYEKSEKGKTIRKKYTQSKNGKAAFKKYQQSEKGKVVNKRANRTYEKSEKGKASRARRRYNRAINEQSVINDLTATEWREILILQNNSCVTCLIDFNEEPATKDHITPVTKGGGLTKDNVQALCRSCNSSKGNKVEMEKENG